MPDIEVTIWEKKQTMTKAEIIRFQLLVHCYVEKIHLSSADLDCLAFLGEKGKMDLTYFCKLVEGIGIFKTAQSGRNAIIRLQDKNLVMKEGKSKKKIYVNPIIKLQNTGNVLVDIKCFSPEKTK